MKPSVTANFRGLQALVVQSDNANRDVLASVLGRLGLRVSLLSPTALPAGGLPPCDVMLVDADEDITCPCPVPERRDVPLIAIIGNEAPSRLARVVAHRCDSHILKPIRTTGVFTALLLAVNGHQRHAHRERELEVLRNRLAARREVTRAVLHVMTCTGLGEDAAYEALRQEAMNRRVTIEEVARGMLGTDGVTTPPPPRSCLTRKA